MIAANPPWAPAAGLSALADPSEPPRWTPGERLEALVAARAAAGPDRIALDLKGGALTYRALDAQANRLAHALAARGVRPGDRVGHLFEKSAHAYVSLLAILKAGASFLPIDPATPADRLRFMADDAGLRAVLTAAALAPRCAGLDAAVLTVDTLDTELADLPSTPVVHAPPLPPDAEAYVIYTSGTTGRPKGVPVWHASICSFVRVVGQVYGYRPDDRVYQGMTLAFDFSFEELFAPWVAGATVVPAPGGLLVGDDLWAFLDRAQITALCCVPTLLASVPRDLPRLRLLLLGGEASPADLVARWAKPGRRILNTYGPTEATITCTAGPLIPDRPVTIGVPLPTYSIVVLAPDEAALVPRGELGEIGIAGVGLARGYLNRPDTTRAKFIPDFVGLPHNPSGRIYRTGDLGRINADGEVEFHGRIDTQVKLRGYRVELTEIESVLMDCPGVAQAVVAARGDALVAYYTLHRGAADLDRGQTRAALAQRLPRYMVPAWLERLDAIPLSASNKVDREALPPPAGPRLTAAAGPARPPETPLEADLLQALRATLDLPACGTDAHFFDDLGANSLSLAGFATAARVARPELRLSIRDCYQHPSVRALARHLAERPAPPTPALALAPATHRPSRAAYGATALGQAAFGTAVAAGLFWGVIAVARWLLAVYGQPAMYARAFGVGVAVLLGSLALSVGGKWLLIGRYRAETVPLWSARYFRHWVARQLIAFNPLVAFKGTPVFNLYLRLLGAKVSLSAVIEARRVPFCTDLLTVGPGCVLRRDVLVPGYRVQGDGMTLGPVTLGAGVYVGHGSVLDIHTTLEDGAQLGHASCVPQGHTLRAGRSHHGSPAVETDTRFAPLPSQGSAVLRGFIYAAALTLPALAALPLLLYVGVSALAYGGAAQGAAALLLRFARDPLPLLPGLVGLVSALFVLAHGLAVARVVLWPRLLNLGLRPGRTWRLYGVHHFLFRLVRALSNSTYLNVLFGDSVLITRYLRAIGFNLNRVIQTGSNFGTAQRHDSPFLCEIGSGTVASDGLSMITLHLSATHFRLAPAAVPGACFLGNDVRVLPEARVGRNCLLGSKVAVPVDGPLREDTGLLGSPAFEIPRIVERDVTLLARHSPAQRAQRLRQKTRHNLVTALLFLASNWLYLNVATALTVFLFAGWIWGGVGLWLALGGLALAYTVGHFALAERLSTGLRPLPTGMFSIYERPFWGIERYWKVSTTPLMRLFRGTPLRGTLLRLLGVKVGRMLFDDGAIITERTLVRIGDRVNLGDATTVQSHSLEDGAFKCAPITLGDGCALLPGAFVHYGVAVGAGAVVECDAFVMKGSQPAAGSRWVGNPAAPADYLPL